MKRYRVPPPGQFRFREVDGRGVISCARCGHLIGDFKPHELFAHAVTGRAYVGPVCDAYDDEEQKP